MMKRIFSSFLVVLGFALTTNVLFANSSLTQEEISHLANKTYDIKHYFFYDKDIKKSFLISKGSKAYSLYYFHPSGSWEPVSNAPAFRSFPAADKIYSDVTFDLASNQVKIGGLAKPNQNPQQGSITQTPIVKDPASKSNRPTAEIMTTMGTITLELYSDIAPKTVENFIYLSELGKYNDLIFHRVIKDFMIQGGDPKGDGTGGMSKWGKTFEDEFDEAYNFDEPYLLAMANSGPNTNGSQFFITTVKTPWLNQKHTIFGKVIAGQKVVQDIEKVETFQEADKKDKPKKDIKIVSVKIKP